MVLLCVRSVISWIACLLVKLPSFSAAWQNSIVILEARISAKVTVNLANQFLTCSVFSLISTLLSENALSTVWCASISAFEVS